MPLRADARTIRNHVHLGSRVLQNCTYLRIVDRHYPHQRASGPQPRASGKRHAVETHAYACSRPALYACACICGAARRRNGVFCVLLAATVRNHVHLSRRSGERAGNGARWSCVECVHEQKDASRARQKVGQRNTAFPQIVRKLARAGRTVRRGRREDLSLRKPTQVFEIWVSDFTGSYSRYL